ncbi:hypothetical protein D5086_023499 [Populus alba]|uniref:Uncharacterized protein n=1 Tax=Populus alba TaxID=43335 RepID=A0ACC4B9X1_POPAL
MWSPASSDGAGQLQICVIIEKAVLSTMAAALLHRVTILSMAFLFQRKRKHFLLGKPRFMMMQDPLRVFLSPLNQEVAQKLQKDDANGSNDILVGHDRIPCLHELCL